MLPHILTFTASSYVDLQSCYELRFGNNLSYLNRDASLCRDVFQDFEPVGVAKLNEKRITAVGSIASSLLSELKLRVIIENARQMCKVCARFKFSLLSIDINCFTK